MSWNRKFRCSWDYGFKYVFYGCSDCKIDPVDVSVNEIWTHYYVMYPFPRRGSIRDKLNCVAQQKHRMWHKIRVHMLQK